MEGTVSIAHITPSAGANNDEYDETSAILSQHTDETMTSKTTHNSGQYGSFVAYCFSVNYILGVGVLSIPYAFYMGGIVAGPLMLLLVTIFAIFAFVWIVETLARAEAYVSADEALAMANAGSGDTHLHRENNADLNETAPTAVNNDNVSVEDDDDSMKGEAHTGHRREESMLVDAPFSDSSVDVAIEGSSPAVTRNPDFKITGRKFEMNEVTNLFLGPKIKIVYDVLVALYLYGALWSYSTVFAESMASHIPFPVVSIANGLRWVTCNVYTDTSLDCTITYGAYIFIFGLMVVPLTCLNLTEQKALQVFMALFRFFALGLMIVTVTLSIFFDPYSRYPSKPDTPLEQHGPYLSPNYIVNLFGFATLFPVAIYSQIVHHSIPGLSQPVKNKSQLNKIFTLVFFSMLILYALLGTTLSAYYGPNTMPTITLNFGFFRGGASWEEPVQLWAKVVIFIIVIFPAVDVLSAFPLNAITLGNNMFAAFFTGTKWMRSRPVEVMFRLLAAIPPLIGSFFVRNLATILQYVGLIGFLITFIIPPVLNLVSRYHCEKRFRASKTPYTLPFISSTPSCLLVLFFAVFAVSYCIMTNALVNFGRLPG